jgi:hypothetical protein
LELLALLEPGIVIFPPGPGAAASSRESNCAELLTLIAGPVVFPFLTARSPLFPLLPLVAAEETFALDEVWVTAPAAPLGDEAGGSLNAGAFASGCGRLAPLPPNVPFDGLFPPKPE